METLLKSWTEMDIIGLYEYFYIYVELINSDILLKCVENTNSFKYTLLFALQNMKTK